MVLPGALLFPHALLPLHIFEPRYRTMLTHALAGDRMFCIALMKPGVQEARRADDFFQVCGLGLVRACVGNADGTSNLILQGIARVRFTGYVQERPFRIARLAPVRAEDDEPTLVPAESDVVIEALGAKVIELCRGFQERGIELPAPLEAHLAQSGNAEFLADLIAAQPFFVSDPFARQQILETPSLPGRLRLLIKHLGAELQ